MNIASKLLAQRKPKLNDVFLKNLCFTKILMCDRGDSSYCVISVSVTAVSPSKDSFHLSESYDLSQSVKGVTQTSFVTVSLIDCVFTISPLSCLFIYFNDVLVLL